MPQMPPVEVGGHLLRWLFEVGPTMSNGMGQTPISSTELRDWLSITGVRLTPWEVRTLRILSMAYVGEYSEASDPKHPAPWLPDEATADDKQATAKTMRASLRSMAGVETPNNKAKR